MTERVSIEEIRMFVLVPKAERGILLFWMLQLRHNGFKESYCC